MNKWFFINTLILLYAVWNIAIGHIALHTILGGLGLLFILFNWMRHAIFSMIRSNIPRKRKITYAKISKKYGWLHKWSGSLALLVLIGHGYVNIDYFGMPWKTVKMASGFLALLTLAFVVLFGWLRFIRTTVLRRYIHWGLAYTLIFFIIVHLLL